MQLHIVGTNTSPVHSEAALKLASVLEFLNIDVVVEERFSGSAGSGVVLLPPADVSGIDATVPVLLLDIDGNMRDELVGVERADGISPVGIIRSPFSPDQLSSALRAVRLQYTLRLASDSRKASAKSASSLACVPGDHPLLDALRVNVVACAGQEGCVLIQGETGTGKRGLAEAIHRSSQYSDGPFVPVSCATFPEALLAIELFGCESGALPGATTRRIGRIELAEGGVLLLEDIEALSIQSQASLLAFLRSGRLERVGSIRGASCDLRLLVSTSANLESLVEQGEFREDLYYALQNQVVNVPALRDYAAAIPGMLAEFDPVFHTGALSSEAWKVLHRYSWPGNVSELANFASQSGPMIGDGSMDVADLPQRLLGEAEAAVQGAAGTETPVEDDVRLPVNGLDLKVYLADLEKNLIKQALEDTGFVVARAADRLHIRRTTLVEKMRKYGLQRS